MPMPNPTLIQILRSRTHLTDEQILQLSDGEGWKIIRELDDAKRKEMDKPEICFTGFNLAAREELEKNAMIKGYRVRKTVTKKLDVLVLGETPGETKIAKAESQGVQILQLHEYQNILSAQDTTDDAPPTTSDPAKEIAFIESNLNPDSESVLPSSGPQSTAKKPQKARLTSWLKTITRWFFYFIAWFVLTGIAAQINELLGVLVCLSPIAWLLFKLFKWAFRRNT